VPHPLRSPFAARPALTGRALVLGAVVVLLVVLLAAPINRFLQSRSDVGTAAKQLTSDRARLAALRHQQQLWSDPGYIQQQARTRLQFAMPGDTVYVVVRKGQRSDLQQSAGIVPVKAGGPAWNTRLWDSVRAADR
jgi:cell division protein FtsB